MKINERPFAAQEARKAGMASYVVESKPLDGRYDNVRPFVTEGEFPPIYDKLGIVAFTGGRFPSGHKEVYTPNEGPWYVETLPMSKDKATDYLAERLSRFGIGSADGDPPFEYRIRNINE